MRDSYTKEQLSVFGNTVCWVILLQNADYSVFEPKLQKTKRNFYTTAVSNGHVYIFLVKSGISVVSNTVFSLKSLGDDERNKK